MIKLARRVLCLDWDKRTVRLVVAHVGPGETQLDDAHSHRIPGNVDPDDPEAMGALIAQLLRRHRVRISRVIVDVPRDKAVINRLTVPPTPLNELAAAVRFQAMRELPFPIDEARIDYVITAQNEEHLATQVLLAAVRLETLDRLRATCEAAGLTPARFGLRPYANMVSVMHLPAMLDRRVLLVDVGPTMTEIDIVCGKVLAFSRAANVTVPFHGGELDTEDSRVSSKAALAGLELADSVASTAVNELLVEITRTLQAYRATEGAAAIDQIVIAGGTGIENALVEAVDERFGLPAMLFDPTVALGVDEEEAPKLRAFAATLGLAWGLSKEGLLELDFLNPKKPIPPQQTLKRRLRIGGIAAAVLLLAGVSYVVADRIMLKRELADLGKQTQQLRERVLESVEIDIKRMEAEEWDAEARAGVWLDHLLWLTQQTIQPGQKMLLSDVDFNVKNADITLHILASDRVVATEFTKKLNELTNEDGQRIYKAEQGTWAEVKTIDPRFKGKVDIRIELLELAGRQTLKQREAEYRRLRKVG
ncbi:MAG: pilus assembly protein PilM [Phycisphaerae bacterium]